MKNDGIFKTVRRNFDKKNFQHPASLSQPINLMFYPSSSQITCTIFQTPCSFIS